MDNPGETARHRMWCRLIPGYGKCTRSARKKLRVQYLPSDIKPYQIKPQKEDYMSSDCCTACAADYSHPSAYTKPTMAFGYKGPKEIEVSTGTVVYNDMNIPLAYCTTKAYPAKCVGSNKKDDNMFNSTSDLEIQQRNFLRSRAADLEASKRSDLRELFHMDYVFTPKTKDEFLAAITAGTIELPENCFSADGSNLYGYNATTLLHSATLLDKNSPKDRTGYDAAKAKLQAALTDLKDDITVKPLADAVTAFEAFKAATFH